MTRTEKISRDDLLCEAKEDGTVVRVFVEHRRVRPDEYGLWLGVEAPDGLDRQLMNTGRKLIVKIRPQHVRYLVEHQGDEERMPIFTIRCIISGNEGTIVTESHIPEPPGRSMIHEVMRHMQNRVYRVLVKNTEGVTWSH